MKLISTGNVLGGFIFLFFPFLSFIRLFGYRVNITITLSILLIFLSIGIRIWNLCFFGYYKKIRLRLISDFFVLLFFVFVFVFAIVTYFTIVNYPFVQFQHLLSLAILCPLFYFFGLEFALDCNNRLTNIIFWVLIIQISGFLLAKNLELISLISIKKGSYYQYTGDTLALFAIFYEIFTKRGLGFFKFIIVFILLLYIGSRASLISFLLAMLISGIGKKLMLIAVLFLFSFNLIIQNVNPESNFLSKSRVLGTFYKFSKGKSDGSQYERNLYFAQTFDLIKRNPLGFDVLYDFKLNGYFGGYVHSMLDLWTRFGLLAFLIFVFIICGGIIELFVRSLRIYPIFFIRELIKSRILVLFVFLFFHFLLFRHPESLILFMGLGILSALLVRFKKQQYAYTQAKLG